MATIFVTGGTGYIGTYLIVELLRRGHTVSALARTGSETKLPAGCTPFIGNVLDSTTYCKAMNGFDTLVHLVGVAHPSPSKAEEFKSIDLASVQSAMPLAKECGVNHVVYLSVAHPAPIMYPYWQTRVTAEEIIQQLFTHCTFVRPWYVLGPGHWWPYILKPLYGFWKAIPSTRATAQRLDLVTINQITRTLAHAVENVPTGIRIIEAQEIKSL